MAAGEGVRAPSHVATRLIGAARRDWPRFDGWCASRGIDPEALPVDRLCNLVWHRIVEHKRPEEIDRLEAELWKPPPGTEASSGAWAPDEELAAFGRLSSDASALQQGAPVA